MARTGVKSLAAIVYIPSPGKKCCKFLSTMFLPTRRQASINEDNCLDTVYHDLIVSFADCGTKQKRMKDSEKVPLSFSMNGSTPESTFCQSMTYIAKASS